MTFLLLPRSRRAFSSNKGFTLLELLVVVTISAALILLLSRLYWMVGKASGSLNNVQNDWLLDQFMRNQIYALDQKYIGQGAFHGEPQRLRFVTRHSASNGAAGVLTLSEYNYDEFQEELRYRERVLPPWWNDQLNGSDAIQQVFNSGKVRNWWSDVALTRVTELRFSYSAGKLNEWVNRWQETTQVPALIKLEYQYAGQLHQTILQPMALSSYMRSGS